MVPATGGNSGGNADGNARAIDRWPISQLTYFIEKPSKRLTMEEVRQGLGIAFGEWSRVTNFLFSEVTSGGNIVIGFYSGEHEGGHRNEDFYPGTLAHAERPEGDVTVAKSLYFHLNEDISWSSEEVTPVGGTDFISVALHEIGHSLGLSHSENRDAVMYREILRSHRTLHPTDIMAIQALYVLDSPGQGVAESDISPTQR